MPGPVTPPRSAVRKLYTFIVDLHGGTYVSQTNAVSATAALTEWARTFDFGTMSRPLLERRRREVLEEIRRTGERPTRLAGLRGAWCATATIGELPPANITIVETSAPAHEADGRRDADE